MAPPKVRFLTKIYHPNIGTLFAQSLLDIPAQCSSPHRQTRSDMPGYPERYSSFRIEVLCTAYSLTRRILDKWSPALQIRTVLLSIQALLSSPNPDDPLATDVAKHYKEDEKDAQRVSREWTEKYAV